MLVLVDIYYHRQSWSYIRFNGPLKFHANLFLAMWIFFLKIAITKVHTFDFLTWGKWSFYGIIFLFIIFFVVSQLVFEFSFHRWVVNNLGILQPCLTLQNEKTYSWTKLTGTNYICFKFLSLDNDWHVCPSFFFRNGYSFYRNQMYIHNLHRLYFAMDYMSMILIPKHYLLLFLEITTV